MASDRAWRAAFAEHDEVLAACRSAIDAMSPDHWRRPRAVGKWSPADEVEHLRLAYAFGIDAVQSGAAMRLAVPPIAAWFAGHVLLPLALFTRRFPRGAAAPPEVIPSGHAASDIMPPHASAQLARIAGAAAAALHAADRERRSVQVVHAYFGALTPYSALRLLSAHTRHHTMALRAAAVGAHSIARRGT